jgi:hypothetical protein
LRMVCVKEEMKDNAMRQWTQYTIPQDNDWEK